MVIKRGRVWWYRFQFQGRLIRESARTGSKTLAKEAERQRRHELARAYNRVPRRRERMPMFADAADAWLAGKTGLASKSYRAYKDRLAPLKSAFGGRLVCDIGLADIAGYQAARLAAGMSARTINYDVLALRGILKAHGLWAELADRVKNLRANRDVGRAITAADETKIISACAASPNPAMLPLFVLAVDTGLRAGELRVLRWEDLGAHAAGAEMEAPHVRVRKSKTEAGTGRVIPLSRRGRAALAVWAAHSPARRGADYIFPRLLVGIGGDRRRAVVRVQDPGSPAQEWKNAWHSVCRAAGVRYRWHDCRHTFISRLAENPAVSEGTIMALAGHVSKAMLARYSHIRMQAKQDAIAAMERQAAPLPAPRGGARRAARGAVN